MTDEERKAPNNLIVLCWRHHVKTNNIELYPVPVLQKMKADHDSNWAEHNYTLPYQALDRIIEEQLQFENEVSRINTAWCESSDLAMNLTLNDDPSGHLNEVSSSITKLEQLLNEFHEFLYDLAQNIEAFLDDLGYDLTNYQNVPRHKIPFHNQFGKY